MGTSLTIWSAIKPNEAIIGRIRAALYPQATAKLSRYFFGSVAQQGLGQESGT
jgi:hypothetical protein